LQNVYVIVKIIKEYSHFNNNKYKIKHWLLIFYIIIKISN